MLAQMAAHAAPDSVSFYCHAKEALLGGSSLAAKGQFGSIQFRLRVFSVCKHQTPGW